MTVTFRASASAELPSGSTGKSVTCNKPTGTVSGDLMVAIVQGDNNNADNHYGPSGWTKLSQSVYGTGHGQSVWWKKAGASEGSTYTFGDSDGTNDYMGVMILTYTSGSSVSVKSTKTGNSSADNISVSETANLTHLIVQSNYSSGNNANFSHPSGWTITSRATNGLPSARISEYVPTSSGTRSPSFSTTYSSQWVFRVLSIVENTTPNAPTNLAPASSTVIDKDATQRFSWTFSDPDAGDAQSAYDLRYRLVGAPSWTTVSGSSTQYRDFAAGTFAAGDYEWQVRTTDNAGSVGPYSASALFTAATTPATPSISDPISGGTISTETYVVKWTAPAQTDYEVRRVADSAGSPDTSTVYSTTGTVTSGTREATITFDVNSRTEHVQVRVRDGSLWSAWASVSVNVSYTPPPTPTISLVSNDSEAWVSVTIANPAPTGSQPVVSSNEVWVRIASGGRRDVDRTVGGDGIRIATGVTNSGTFYDYAVRANTVYEYRVKAVGDNDVSAWSAWTAAT